MSDAELYEIADKVANRTNVSTEDVLETFRVWDVFKWDDIITEPQDIYPVVGSTVLLCVYLIFIAFYLSRVAGLLATLLLNRFLTRHGYSANIGSISISFLSGKIMVRDFALSTVDWTVRFYDGWVQLCYWKWYSELPIGQDMSGQPNRLVVFVNALDVYVYNQLWRYEHINDVLEQDLFDKLGTIGKPQPRNRKGKGVEAEVKGSNSEQADAGISPRLLAFLKLCARFKYIISSGRVIMGNEHLLSSLVTSFDSGSGIYTTKPPSNGSQSGDHFLHFTRGQLENVRVTLVKTRNYSGRKKYEEPPRTMGDGFAVLQTEQLDYSHAQDHLGPVKCDVQQAGALVPRLFTDIRLGKNTTISYGPWADKQRDALYSFFYPIDFRTQPVTPMPTQGCTRVHVKWQFRFTALHDSILNVPFMREDEPKGLYTTFKSGSHVDMCVPWITGPDGYDTRITGQLLGIEMSTSMAYQNFFDCERAHIDFLMSYPRKWNDQQLWLFKFELAKATASVLFEHKDFFTHLYAEWQSENRPDMCHHIPYVWKFVCNIRDFDALFPANEHNWLDTSSSVNAENTMVSLAGRRLSLDWQLNNEAFMPTYCEIDVHLKAETLSLSVGLPEQSLLRPIMLSLQRNARMPKHFLNDETCPIWRGTSGNTQWINMARAPNAQCNVKYKYHPMYHEPDLGQVPEAVASAVLRPWHRVQLAELDVAAMAADECEVWVAVQHAQLKLTGLIIKLLFDFKDNYAGLADHYSDIATFERQDGKPVYGQNTAPFRPEVWRALSCKLRVEITETEGAIPIYSAKHIDADDQLPIPRAFLEHLVFELDKCWHESRLQLNLSPMMVRFAPSQDSAFLDEANMSMAGGGSLKLDALQFRGHGCFSDKGLPHDAPTLEYAWLMELIIGNLSGQLHPGDLVQVSQFAESMIHLLLAEEEKLAPPKAHQFCEHMYPPNACPKFIESNRDGLTCPTEYDLKYTMFRASADSIRIAIAERHAFVRLCVDPFRLVVGLGGLPALQQSVLQTVRVQPAQHGQQLGRVALCARTQRQHVRLRQRRPAHRVLVLCAAAAEWLAWLVCWLIRREIVVLAGTKVDVSLPMKLCSPEQRAHRHEFMRKHDAEHRQLKFLWDPTAPVCGCVGGTQFMGLDRDGSEFFDQPTAPLALENITDTMEKPGFGQSLIKEKLPVFEPTGWAERMAFTLSGNVTQTGQLRRASAVKVGRQASVQTGGSSEGQRRRYQQAQAGSVGSSLDSFHTTVEDNKINLLSHVNRPLLESQLLMMQYSRYLTAYEYVADISNGKRLRTGMNDLQMFDNNATSAASSKHTVKHKHTGASDIAVAGGSVEVLGSLAESCQLFVTPLGCEVTQRLLAAGALEWTRQHPLFIVQQLFTRCSFAQHKQPLIRLPQADAPLQRLQVHLTLPYTSIGFFQCGMVEKTISVVELEKADSLVRPSVMLACCSQLVLAATTTTTAQPTKKTSTVKIDSAASANTANAHEQVLFRLSTGANYLQLHEVTNSSVANANNFGISKETSKFDVSTNFSKLTLPKQHRLRLIIESLISDVNVTLTRPLQLPALLPETGPSFESQAAALKQSNMPPKRSHTVCTVVNESTGSGESTQASAKNEKVWSVSRVHVGLVEAHFALLQPVHNDKYQKNGGSGSSVQMQWPLYDLLGPSVTAWIHCLHRLTVSAAQVFTSFETWGQLCLAKLLTEVMDTSHTHVFNVPKSKFAGARVNERFVHGCPSCQVLLTLLRFANAYGVEDNYESEILNCGDDLSDCEQRRKALVVLFSHWQTVLCAEKMVTVFDPALVHRFKTKAPGGSEHMLSSPGSTAPSEIRLDVNKQQAAYSTSKEVKEHLQRAYEKQKQLNPHHRRTTSSAAEVTSITSSGLGSPRTAHQSGTKDNKDLYMWMREQQKTRDPSSLARHLASLPAPEHDADNLMELSLPVCFMPIFNAYKLEPEGVSIAALGIVGPYVRFAVELAGCKIDVVEPKLVPGASNVARVAHRSLPLLHVDALQFSGDVSANGVRSDALHARLRTAHINVAYRLKHNQLHLHLGFGAASFIYQVALAAKCWLDTSEELTIHRQQEQMHVKLSRRVSTASALQKAGSAESVATGSTRTAVEPSAPKHWSERLTLKLRDYERSEKRRLALLIIKEQDDSNCGGLTTTTSGVLNINNITIDATLTELYISVTLSELHAAFTSMIRKRPQSLWSPVSQNSELPVLLEGRVDLSGGIDSARLILSQLDANDSAAEAQSHTILSFNVAKSNVLLNRSLIKPKSPLEMGPSQWKTVVTVDVGPLDGDIPMHPGFLHEVVLRSGPELNEQLTRFNAPAAQLTDELFHGGRRVDETPIGQYSRALTKSESLVEVHFAVNVASLQLSVALLPSLRVTYRLESASSNGVTGAAAAFKISVRDHYVMLKVVADDLDESIASITPIKIDLPGLRAEGAYISSSDAQHPNAPRCQHLVYQAGGYVKVDVYVRKFEHTLTTDLLNQLLFVQEAFRRELGDIVQRLTAERMPIAIPKSHTVSGQAGQAPSILYSIEVKGETTRSVEITATTPTLIAIRLCIDDLHCHLTNRWVARQTESKRERLFGQVQLCLSLALGQLIKSGLYDEIEAEFVRSANFLTRINVETENIEQKEDATTYKYLIDVNHPCMSIEPSAVDKGVLLWLNFKNTVEFWNQQRRKILFTKTTHPTWHRKSTTVTSPLSHPHKQLTRSTPEPVREAIKLFRLSVVDGLQISMPLCSNLYPDSFNSAIVIRLEKTEIEVLSHKGFVSKGKFEGFVVHFTDNYDDVQNTWQPSSYQQQQQPQSSRKSVNGTSNNEQQPRTASSSDEPKHDNTTSSNTNNDPSRTYNQQMFSESNYCYFPEGTYEMHTTTTEHLQDGTDAKRAEWNLNVLWNMKGMQMDVNKHIGKLTSMLVSTLTAMATDTDHVPDGITFPGSSRQSQTNPGSTKASVTERTPHAVPEIGRAKEQLRAKMSHTGSCGSVDSVGTCIDRNLQQLTDAPARTAWLEKEMHQQSVLVSDMQQYGASEATLEIERRKLRQLEVFLFKEFRAGMMDKFRKQSRKASFLKDNFGLALPASTNRRQTLAQLKRQQTVDASAAGHPANRAKMKTRSGSVDSKRLSTIMSRDSSGAASVDTGSSSDSESLIDFDQLMDAEDKTADDEEGAMLSSSQNAQPAELVDFYLDIQIDIDTGTCTFHTTPDAHMQANDSHRSLSGFGARQKSAAAMNRLRATQSTQGECITRTVLNIPSVSARSHYASLAAAADRHKFNIERLRLSSFSFDEDTIARMMQSSKNANFFMKLELKSMPTETVLTPHLLDFIEQTLERVPTASLLLPTSSSHTQFEAGGSSKVDGSEAELSDPTIAAVERSGLLDQSRVAGESFPVEFEMLIIVQSSCLHFKSSSPNNMAADCELTLPECQMMLTNRKTAVVSGVDTNLLNGNGRKVAFPIWFDFRIKTPQVLQRSHDTDTIAKGVFLTICLCKFKLRIFSPLADKHKHALHLAIHTTVIELSRGSNQLTAATRDFVDAQGQPVHGLINNVRFSVLADVDNAKFEYDMRRLRELLSFPKAWYRRALTRRLFFGDTQPTPAASASNSRHAAADTSLHTKAARRSLWQANVLVYMAFQQLNVKAHMSNTMGQTEWHTSGALMNGRVDVKSTGTRDLSLKFSLGQSALTANGGLISGAISLQQLRSFTRHKWRVGMPPDNQCKVKLSNCDVRIEWMSNVILVARCTDFETNMSDEWRNTVDVLTQQVTRASVFVNMVARCRLFHIIITRTTIPDFIRIALKLQAFFQEQLQSGMSMWGNTGLSFVSQSPTHLSRMSSESDETASLNSVTTANKFFRTWQRALELITDIQCRGTFFRLPPKGVTVLGGELQVESDDLAVVMMMDKMSQSNEWAIVSLRQAQISFTPEAQYIVLNKLDFSDDSDTTAHEGNDDTSIGVSLSQELCIRLGQQKLTHERDVTNAVCARAERSNKSPLGALGSSAHNTHAFTQYLIDGVLQQCGVYPDYKPGKGSGSDNTASHTASPRDKNSSSDSTDTHQTLNTKKRPDYRVTLFMKFPPSEARLMTRQAQTAGLDTHDVLCSFVSNFDDHIYINTDTNFLFLFLPNLVRGYANEYELLMRQLEQQQPHTSASNLTSSNKAEQAIVIDKDKPLNIDPLRTYKCETWELRPNVRFLDNVKWDPQGVNLLLQKFGILDQRQTIPKWLQRLIMDPMDDVIALLVERNLVISNRKQM